MAIHGDRTERTERNATRPPVAVLLCYSSMASEAAGFAVSLALDASAFLGSDARSIGRVPIVFFTTFARGEETQTYIYTYLVALFFLLLLFLVGLFFFFFFFFFFFYFFF